MKSDAYVSIRLSSETQPNRNCYNEENTRQLSCLVYLTVKTSPVRSETFIGAVMEPDKYFKACPKLRVQHYCEWPYFYDKLCSLMARSSPFSVLQFIGQNMQFTGQPKTRNAKCANWEIERIAILYTSK